MDRSAVSAPATVKAMRSRAHAFLAALSPLSRRRAAIDPTDQAERARWYYTPNPRRGVMMHQLPPGQQQLALRLLASGLSDAGFTAANLTMSLENLIDRDHSWQEPRSRRGGRDPMRYTIAIFGEPSAWDWGWRFEGHHLSIRYQVSGDEVSCTPLFLGGHPARSPLPGGQSLDAPLTPEAMAIELLDSLSETERARAMISTAAPIDIVTSNRSVVRAGSEPRSPGEMIHGRLTPEWARWTETLREELGASVESDEALRLPEAPDGIPRSALEAESRDRLDRLIDYFLQLTPDEVAAGYRARIASGAGPHFAWAGSPDIETAGYFRIRNEHLLIEFNNAQDQANHVHSVWRDPGGDFGRDLLGEPAVEAGSRKRSLVERVVSRLDRLRD